MKILLTGANGYIGRSLYEALKDKHEVTRLTREECDLTSLHRVALYFWKLYDAKERFDVVIHCAAVGGNRLVEDSAKDVLDTNLQMFYHLAQHHKSFFDKFICFGSGAEIYSSDKPYGLSKKIIADSINERDGFYNLRIFGVFDENELDRRFIKASILRYLRGDSLEIHDNRYFDFFYMQDLIKLVEYYLTEQNPPKVTECRYDTTKNLGGIANLINELGEHKVDISISNPYGGAYVGTLLPPSLDYVGLEQGIRNVYNALK